MRKNIKPLVLLGFILFLFFIAITFKFTTKQPTNLIEPTTVTEIIEYKQTYVPEEKRTGYCWDPSIAASNNVDAYRCSSKDQIFDPCFKEESGTVVCGVDPEQSGSGFELQLTKDIIEYTKPTESSNWLPWRLKLEDGKICSLFTGTAAIVDGKTYYIYCENDENGNSVNGELDKSKNLWKINLIHGNKDNNVVFTETVDVIKVWK